MICLNPILKSPLLAALVAGCGVMLYFVLMSYSPNLPPAVLCSLAVAYFVYFMMGGKVLCDDVSADISDDLNTVEVQQRPLRITEVLDVPEPAPATPGPEAIATVAIANHVHPPGKPVSAYRVL
jgi:hypothetical protein